MCNDGLFWPGLLHSQSLRRTPLGTRMFLIKYSYGAVMNINDYIVFKTSLHIRLENCFENIRGIKRVKTFKNSFQEVFRAGMFYSRNSFRDLSFIGGRRAGIILFC
jgi:hypothetical protein